MFEREGSAPDVLDVEDPAVRRCSPPIPVWVDLAALTQHREHGKPYSDARPGGVFVGGLVRGLMWAQVMSDRGLWLGCRPGLEVTADRSAWSSVSGISSRLRCLHTTGSAPSLEGPRAERSPLREAQR
jgi:hypothetical protein